MATTIRKASKPNRSRQALIEQMEKAAPSGKKLRQLVAANPAPQQWYDEDSTVVVKRKPKR
jgi:hypothetical protein